MRFFSLLLKPLSYSYGLVLILRHWLYDRGFLASYRFEFPVIVIGNLSLGGSGKTPMTIYLADYLSEKIQTVILSRGYGRESSGFLEVESENQPKKYGDEPCLIKSKNDRTRNFVGEDRVDAIHKIDELITEKKVIILDDAFQHRKLRAGLNILLTDFENLFPEDELVPSGKLRDIKERSQIADLIIVTKSPNLPAACDLSYRLKSIEKYSNAPVIFSSIFYQKPINYFTKKEVEIHKNTVLLTALANSKSFVRYFEKNHEFMGRFHYGDHHIFKESELIHTLNCCVGNGVNQLTTTEKDAVKLNQFQNLFEEYSVELIVIPIQMKFEKEDEKILKHLILSLIN